ncbi:ABC transporter permease subunit [Aurantimonas aggregata]|uniref:ABC transporter permease subunit n=1 Tax=Aurantimonas aggregata TaxID=2047720 RepID=A0A6L9MGS5_9HYPH|nr:ABC transporter permease [Aurantimonas aggregata]NDV87024.1 ABC transporter permease subunit [Aurantimonas aggregata]
MSRVLTNLLSGTLAVFVLWQISILVLSPPAYMMPAPLDVLATLFDRRAFLLHHSGITLLEIALGMFFGTLAGVVIALAVTSLPGMTQIVWPMILVLQALPVFAIAPLLVLWFGFGLASKVVMAGLIIFFPVASAFADGLRRTDPTLLEEAELSGADRWQILRLVRIPLALPALVTGLRVAAPLAPLGAVIGEWVGASGGLGFIMLQANARMQADILFAGLLILAVITLVLRFLVDELAGLLVPWAKEAE